MTKPAGPVRVLLAGMAWRSFGSSDAGTTLLRALSGDREQQSMLAGMALVKAGERSVDLIARALEDGVATPPMVRLLADLDGERARALLREIETGPDTGLAEAARESLELLRRIEALDDEGSSP